MALQSLDIVRRSATTTPEPGVRQPAVGPVAKLIDTTKCIGCKACQVACMEWNDLRDEIGTNVGVYDNPPDLTDASWTVMRFAEYENPKGDLEPACIKACPTGALVFGTKEDMQQHAAERVADLKSRGFEQAGLYDPPGVGGTHVMYVLHHADQPQLYAGLAPDPHISALVGLWKGASKPWALALMGLTALAGFFHFVRIGRNRIEDSDEAAAQPAVEAARRSAPPGSGGTREKRP